VKTENPVKVGIESAMKGLPFRRKSTTWYHESEEAVVVLNVQKSNFGEQYYINLGALVKGLGSTREGIPPRENECHLRLRIESLVPEKQELIQRVMLNLEDNTVGSAEREQIGVCVSAIQGSPRRETETSRWTKPRGAAYGTFRRRSMGKVAVTGGLAETGRGRSAGRERGPGGAAGGRGRCRCPSVRSGKRGWRRRGRAPDRRGPCGGLVDTAEPRGHGGARRPSS
jgi:hypothetical protein